MVEVQMGGFIFPQVLTRGEILKKSGNHRLGHRWRQNSEIFLGRKQDKSPLFAVGETENTWRNLLEFWNWNHLKLQNPFY